MARLVPIVHPIITAPEAVRAVAEAYRRLFNRWPTQAELIILAAQSSHETNEWASAPGYNVAGLKASFSGVADYFEAWTTEYVDQPDGSKKSVKVVQRFRSYPDLAAGMFDWLSLLSRGYPEAMKGARAGDVSAFVAGLLLGWGRGARYFTSPPEKYLSGVLARVAQISHLPLDYTTLTEPLNVDQGEKNS